MNKVIFFLILLIIFANCSFDNKTGIWKDDSVVKEEINKKVETKKKS